MEAAKEHAATKVVAVVKIRRQKEKEDRNNSVDTKITGLLIKVGRFTFIQVVDI